MKYYGKITDPKDLITKEYADQKVPNIGKGINLLRNWYFVGGGSQQGGRQFPLNERGQTVYSGAGYGIDRWRTASWNITAISVTVQSGCILLSGSASGANSCLLYQYLENPAAYAGKTVTASVLVGAVTANIARLWIGANANDSYARSPAMASNGLYSVTTILPADISSLCVTIGQHASSAGSGNTSIEIIAAKLELGDTQTLAHQENGQWVLNDPVPDFEEELFKCQTSHADSDDTYANKSYATTDCDSSNMTATFTAASSRANISTGEKLSVMFGKIAKFFADLGTAAFKNSTSSVTQNSTDLVESGAVYTGLDGKAPTSHASTATTYGTGTDSNYGHLKLSASTSSTSGVSGGIAATPSAVKSAYDRASARAVAESIAIVSNANTHVAISSGQYVYVKGHSTLSEGLYKARTNITANATLSTSNLTAVSGGVANKLVPTTGNLVKLNNNISSVERAFYYKVGQIVVVDLTFTVSSAISTTAELFGGLPEALDYWRFEMLNTDMSPYRGRIAVSGTKISDGYSPGGNFPAGQYEGSFVYVTSE